MSENITLRHRIAPVPPAGGPYPKWRVEWRAYTESYQQGTDIGFRVIVFPPSEYGLPCVVSGIGLTEWRAAAGATGTAFATCQDCADTASEMWETAPPDSEWPHGFGATVTATGRLLGNLICG